MRRLATRAELAALGKLCRASERRRCRALLAEGPRLLAEALHAGLVPGLVAVAAEREQEFAELLVRVERAGAPVLLAPGERLDRVADADHGPGLLVRLPWPQPADPDAPVPAGPRLELALAGLQDPGNVGTLLRSARAFDVGRVHLGPGCADPLSPKALRASAGLALAPGLLHRPESGHELPGAWAAGLQARATERELRLCVALPGKDPSCPPQHSRSQRAVSDRALPERASAERALADRALPRCGLPERALLVLGHETRGAPDLPDAQAVAVPQQPDVDSLNVAVAGSILAAGWYARWCAS